MRKLRDIINMTEDEIIERHDNETSNYSISGDFYLKEYYRKQQEKSNKQIEIMNERMLKYTKWVMIMTLIILIATVLNVGVFIYSIFK